MGTVLIFKYFIRAIIASRFESVNGVAEGTAVLGKKSDGIGCDKDEQKKSVTACAWNLEQDFDAS